MVIFENNLKLKYMELELKHIAPYLPYKLKVVEVYNGKQVNDGFIVDCVNWDGKNIGGIDASLDSFELEMAFNLRDVKPILRPISSITAKEATDFGNILLGEYEMEDRNVGVGSIQMGDTITPVIQFIDSDGDSITVFFGKSEIACDEGISYEAYEWLFKHHFDIFYLIDKGLAIDKNTL